MCAAPSKTFQNSTPFNATRVLNPASLSALFKLDSGEFICFLSPIRIPVGIEGENISNFDAAHGVQNSEIRAPPRQISRSAMISSSYVVGTRATSWKGGISLRVKSRTCEVRRKALHFHSTWDYQFSEIPEKFCYDWFLLEMCTSARAIHSATRCRRLERRTYLFYK